VEASRSNIRDGNIVGASLPSAAVSLSSVGGAGLQLPRSSGLGHDTAWCARASHRGLGETPGWMHTPQKRWWQGRGDGATQWGEAQWAAQRHPVVLGLATLSRGLHIYIQGGLRL
jgi:hypothetical protein